MKSILFFSPDLNLCASLLMFFNEKYSVTTTTDLQTLENLTGSIAFDLLVIDAEPMDSIWNICSRINSEEKKHTPVILTYVYTVKYRDKEKKFKQYIDAVFYKPIDLIEVSNKIDQLLFNSK